MVCELAVDPTERPRQWLGFTLLAGLVVIILVTIPWEFIVRRGQDPGVWTGCLVLISIVLIGPVGVRLVTKRGGDRDDNGTAP